MAKKQDLALTGASLAAFDVWWKSLESKLHDRPGGYTLSDLAAIQDTFKAGWNAATAAMLAACLAGDSGARPDTPPRVTLAGTARL